MFLLRPTFFLCLLFACLSLAPIASAQENQIKTFTTRDGLAGNYVTAIAFARDDSVWVGTTEGVTHIEPNRWTSYTRAHGLGDSWITAIATAPDERVWFGTQSGGVSVLDPISKTLTTYNLDNSDIPSNFVTSLAIDSQNKIWAGTLNNGVAQFDAETKQWNRRALPKTNITTVTRGFDAQGTLWAIADGHVYALQNERWELRELSNSELAIRLFDDHRQMVAVTPERMYIWNGAAWERYTPMPHVSPLIGVLDEEQVTAQSGSGNDDLWYGTANGLYVIDSPQWLKPQNPLPVLVIHGWTVAGNDTLESSEFRFLKSYADRDGIPMYYVRGVSPKNTLYQNAQVIRDEIARVKKETGADKVNLIGFSMGGMNTRAYLETSLYANDVNRAILLGSPQAGVEVWKPMLFQQILQKPDEPSTIELSPEYAQQVVNATRSPNPDVPYDALIGDASQQEHLKFFADMPASDALISVASSLALDGANVRKHINADLHDWNPQAVPLEFTSYLYPRDTWERYLRNALRNNDNAPIGSEIATPVPAPNLDVPQSNHTPVVAEKISAGETVTRTVLIDENKSARFVAYYPGGKIDFSLVAPDGTIFKTEELPRDEDKNVISLTTDVASFSGHLVKSAPVGTWQMILKRTDNGNEPIDVSTYVELDAARRLTAFQDRLPYDGMRVRVTPDAPNVKISARVGVPSAQHSAPYEFVTLSEPVADVRGPYTKLPFKTPGWYPVFVTAQGDGFERETEFLYYVPANTIAFQSGLPLKIEQDATAPNQNVPSSIGVDVKQAGSFALAAEIHDANDNLIARSFTPITLEAGQQRIPFSLRVPDPNAWYSMQLQLYDTNWAALPAASLQANVKFQQPK